MSFLFKTTLVHLGKNLPIVSVLGFFVSSGIFVLASSDNLSMNLNKGFNEINMDSNPHDLVLVSKSFKPSEKLNVEPKYDLDISKISMTPNYGYRWSFDSNFDHAWKKDKKKETNSLQKTSKAVLVIPYSSKENYAWANQSLLCAPTSSFVTTLSRKLSFVDRNKAGFNMQTENNHTLKHKIPFEDELNEDIFVSSCDESSYPDNYWPYVDYLFGLLFHFHSQKNQNQETKLDKNDIHSIHKQLKSFNPKKFFVYENDSSKNLYYRPLFEEDFYLSFDLPFINELNGVDISQKFKNLITNMTSSDVYYKLNDVTRQNIDLFSKTKSFDKLKVKYYISSLSANLESLDFMAPKMLGMSFDEVAIFFLKLVLWEVLSSSSSITNLQDFLITQKDQRINKIVQNIDFLNTDLNPKNLDNFEIDKNTKNTPAKPTNISDYLFSSTLIKTNQTKEIKDVSDLKEKLKKWKQGEKLDIDFFSRNNNSSDTQTNSTFEKLYLSAVNYVIDSIKQYLVFLNIQNLKIVKKFISDHELFTLSFLLHNFQYRPVEGMMLASDNFSKYKDGTLSVNYHKSLIISNSSNTSAKLNNNKLTSHSFKVITQERKDESSVNRLKIVSGNPLLEAKQDYRKIFNKIVQNQSRPERFISAHEYKDVYKILYRAKYNHPEYSELFKKMYDYVSYAFPDPWRDGKWLNIVDTHKLSFYANQIVKQSKDLKTQGSRLILNFTRRDVFSLLSTFDVSHFLSTVLHVGYIDQFSSFFVLVSPFYAKANGIKPISDQQYLKFKSIVENEDTTQSEWEKEYASFVLNPKNHDHVLNVNGNKLIVVGTALSPDFSLPSHSWLNLIPNKEKEALIFVNNHGFKNISYNSLSSWNEFYLSLAYPQVVKDLGIEEDYRAKLSSFMSDFLIDSRDNSGDNSEFVLRKVKDSNASGLVFLRTNYVENFLSSVNLLSSTLLLFMSIIIFFTVWVLIKKYISSSLNTFGVFVANGIQRKTIISNSFSFVLIPSFIGVVIGYLLSIAFQSNFFDMFANVWYLNPIFSGFSISTLLYYFLLVSSIIIPISFFASWFMLRNNVGNLMKENSVFKQNRWTKYVHNFLGNMSSLWKFRIFIILNTLSRGFILTSATVFLFVFSSFLFNNYGQFANVSNLEIRSKDYGFDLTFETPTDQSGHYLLTSYKNLGDTFFDPTPHTKKVIFKKTDDESSFFSEELKFDKDNPERISTGILSINSPTDLEDFYENCKNQEVDWWRKKLDYFNADYPSRAFLDDPYNLYMFKSSKSTTCNDQITKESASVFNLPKPSIAAMQVFYRSSSAHASTHNSKFKPEVTTKDPSSEVSSLGDYIPVEHEKQTQKEKEMIKFGSEPLFKPLIDFYQKHDQNQTDDFESIGDKKHPKLRKLFKDFSNYWLFSYRDLDDVAKYPVFFKNKVILPILFNHDWTFNILGKIITVNPWTEFSDFFSKYSPELIAAMDDNYVKFVDEIIHSRYSEYFVNRFMTKHVESNVQSHTPGSILHGKKTWRIDKSKIKERSASKTDVNVDDGLYWFDASKIIYFYDKYHFSSQVASQGESSESLENSKHPERFVIFRPDFLYLFYALMKDPHFLKPGVAPIKIVFGQNVYIPDYSNPFEGWEISGDVSKDDSLNKGLTATSSSSIDYTKTPNGDQTYTYVEGDVSNSDLLNVKIVGLKQDARGTYVKLTKDGKNINSKLYESKFNDGNYPIVINKFTAKKLNLNVGSKFDFLVSNTKDRFTKKMLSDKSRKIVSFKVVDIFDSYYSNSFFISQKYANEIIGIDPDYGYNALFTRKYSGDTKELPMQLTHAISGFSPSGIYAKQKISKSSNEFSDFLNARIMNFSSLKLKEHKFIQPKNHEWFRMKSGLPNKNGLDKPDGIAKALESAFGADYALTSSTIGITNASLFNDFVFGSVSDLIISIMNLFVLVFSPLLICSLLIITTLIIEDLKNLLTILNLLGFTYIENSISILLYLGLILSVATIVSLPTASLVLSSYVDKIFNLLSIYLPIYLRVDYAFCSFFILLSMFGFSYWTAMKKIKRIYLPVAMKQLSE